jgi:hypothetical protein
MSPVIATIILLAVSITVAIAVSSYLSGITANNADFEKIEITSAYCTADSNYWTLHFQVKNTGPSAATLCHLMINGVPVDFYGTVATSGNYTTDMTETETIEVGQVVSLQVFMAKNKAGSTFTPGTMVDICFHSVRGTDYIKMVKLT